MIEPSGLRMKVCDVVQSYSDTGGGIRTYLSEKRAFIERNPRIGHVIIVPGERDSKTQDGGLIRYTVKSAAVPCCSPYRFLLRFDKLLSILMEEEPDVIEFGCGYMLPFAGAVHRSRKPCSLFGYYHTDYPDAYVADAVGRQFGVAFGNMAGIGARRYARAVYDLLDMTFVPSAALRDKLTRNGFGRVECVPLGVDLDLFNPVRRNAGIRRRFGLSDSDVLLVYAGRFDMEKHTEIVLEAFQRISPVFKGKLLLIGDGPLKPMVSAYASKNPLIQTLPFQENRKELAGFLASSDIYVTAGPHETFGLSVLEAQASGLAVLGVNAGALRERLSAELGMLVDVGSVDGLGAAMLSLSENGFRRKGRMARAWVESNFSWGKTFERIFQNYGACSAARRKRLKSEACSGLFSS